MAWGEPTKKTETPIISKEDRMKEIKNKLMNKNKVLTNKLTCGIFSTEGTGKSGLVLNYIIKFLKDNPTAFAKVIDVDNGFAELLNFYDSEITKRIFVSNPVTFKETESEGKKNYEIDNIETLNNIKEDIYGIKELINNGDNSFQILVLDGLSFLLKNCENQLRIEKHINIDGGINLSYWKRRNELFLQIIEFIKALPINTFFIGHEDFLRNQTGELSSVKQQLLATLHQIIETSKDIDEKNKIVVFKATIKKSKYNILEEENVYVFAEKTESQYWFDEKGIFSKLKQQTKK